MPAETIADKPPAPGGVTPGVNGEPVMGVSPPELEVIEKPSTASFKKSETYRWPKVTVPVTPRLWFGPLIANAGPNALVDGLMVKAKIWLVPVA